MTLPDPTSLAPFVRILGRGPGRSRSLTQDEASEAMGLILSGAAPPEAIGALLMLMRLRGESAPEIAGFVEAMRARLGGWDALDVAIDWPSYAAGRSRGRPYFLLAAKLVAQAGHKVLIHGWNSHQNPLASVRDALKGAGIPLATTPAEARKALDSAKIAYVPLDAMDAGLLSLLKLRERLGLRSAVNTCLRVVNPAAAASSVQGVFHPPYRDLQRDAGALLGQTNQLIIKGGGGEFERHPSKAAALFRLHDGTSEDLTAPAISDDARRLGEDAATMPDLPELWSGEASDPFAEAVVTGTAALALLAMGGDLEAAHDRARGLWAGRRREHALVT